MLYSLAAIPFSLKFRGAHVHQHWFLLSLLFTPLRQYRLYSWAHGKRHLILEELSETRFFILSNLASHLPVSIVTSFMKGISLISSEGNKPYGNRFERMNGKTEAITAPISVMSQRNFGIWYPKLSSTDTPAMFVDKKYLIQQILTHNFRRVLDLKWDWSQKAL